MMIKLGSKLLEILQKIPKTVNIQKHFYEYIQKPHPLIVLFEKFPKYRPRFLQ